MDTKKERWKMLAGMAASTINTSAVVTARRNSFFIITLIDANSIQSA